MGAFFGDRFSGARSRPDPGTGAVEFALDMAPDAVTLYERALDGNWRKFAAARLDDPEFLTVIGLLRAEAETHAGARAPVRLWLPAEQVLKQKGWVGEDQPEPLRRQAAFDHIARETLYRAEDVALAVGPADEYGEATILVTFAETCNEARDYAARWGFLPGDVSTRAHADAFGAGGPVFSPLPQPPEPHAARGPARTAMAVAALAAIAAGAALWATGPRETAPARTDDNPVRTAEIATESGQQPYALAPELPPLHRAALRPVPARPPVTTGPDGAAAPARFPVPAPQFAAINPTPREHKPAPTRTDTRAAPMLSGPAIRAAEAEAVPLALYRPEVAVPAPVPPPLLFGAASAPSDVPPPGGIDAAVASTTKPGKLQASISPVPAPAPRTVRADAGKKPGAAPGESDRLTGRASPAWPIPKPRPARSRATDGTVIADSAQPRMEAGRTQVPLGGTTLIGIINLDSGRKALLRLPDGRYRSVTIGDVLDGWRVSMIGVDAIRITRRGEDRTLLLVKP